MKKKPREWPKHAINTASYSVRELVSETLRILQTVQTPTVCDAFKALTEGTTTKEAVINFGTKYGITYL